MGSAALGLGEALAAEGPFPFAGETLYETKSRLGSSCDAENAFTGVNATALGFGLNEDALTFNLAVGLPGLSFWLEGGTGVVDFRPLKAGMGWINSDACFVGGSGLTTVFVVEVEATIFAPGAVPFAGLTAEPAGGLRDEAEGVTVEPATPMARAEPAPASCVVFSLIRRCLSSSLARMGTRSSGMGFLS